MLQVKSYQKKVIVISLQVDVSIVLKWMQLQMVKCFGSLHKQMLFCLHIYLKTENAQGPETLNTRAVAVVTRVSNKLTGRDFNPRVTLDVQTQVDKLIQQATSLENLCQCYIGWLVFLSLYSYFTIIHTSFSNRCAFW